MEAYKVFNSDLSCRGFQYKIGETFIHDGEIELCGSGFHACIKAIDCFNYYKFDSKNRVCKVELLGEIIQGDDKVVCSGIRIIEEIPWNDVLNIVNSGHGNSGHGNSGHGNSGNRNSGHRNSGYRNSGHGNSGNRNSGHRNSGYRNSGDWNSGDSNSGHRNSGNWNSGDWNSGYSNSGYRNSGDWNSGDRNSGNWNSGDWNSGYRNSGYRNSGNWNSGDWNSGDRNSGNWNSGDWNSGFFNSNNPDKIRVFNKECDKEIWDNADKPEFIYNLILNKWVYFSDMSEEEKQQHPKAYVCNGYLKSYSYKESWQNAYEYKKAGDIELLKALPNFDSDIFEEITGIKIN